MSVVTQDISSEMELTEGFAGVFLPVRLSSLLSLALEGSARSRMQLRAQASRAVFDHASDFFVTYYRFIRRLILIYRFFIPVFMLNTMKKIKRKNFTMKRFCLTGSYETSVFLKCDGRTLYFEGNISRFGRHDNLFGYSVGDCIKKPNGLLGFLKLLGFSAGKLFCLNDESDFKVQWTGAVVTRIDLTQNYFLDSRAGAFGFMHWLSSQQASRLKTGMYADTGTIDFGRGSRRFYSKVYINSDEMRRHLKNSDSYLERLTVWCDRESLICFETTYKSKRSDFCYFRYSGDFDISVLEKDFAGRMEILSRADLTFDDN